MKNKISYRWFTQKINPAPITYKDKEENQTVQIKIIKITFTTSTIKERCLWYPWKSPTEPQHPVDHSLNTSD
jgi:hypothetical protein